MRGTRLALFVGVLILAAVGVGLSRAVAPVLGLLGRTIVVFLGVKVLGDILFFILGLKEATVFIEDIVQDLLHYLALGTIGAIAIGLYELHIGGPVDPAAPALVVYYTVLWMNRRSANGR